MEGERGEGKDVKERKLRDGRDVRTSREIHVWLGLGRHVNLSLGERNVDDGSMTPWHITRHASCITSAYSVFFSEDAFTRAYEIYDELIVTMHATFHTSRHSERCRKDPFAFTTGCCRLLNRRNNVLCAHRARKALYPSSYS